jgi:hypothetical protein
MMQNFRVLIAAAATVVLVSGASDARAQVERHILTIEKSNVYIDGDRVPEGELPRSLRLTNLNNLSASMNFTGDALLELNGQVYQLEDGRLVEADADVARDGRVMVFFSDPENENATFRVLSRGEPSDSYVGAYSSFDRRPYGIAMDNYFDAFESKAREFEAIRGEIVVQNREQAAALAERLKAEAENTARIVKAFPRVEFESYLEDVQRMDASLYRQLVQESSIETETHRLAMEARAENDAERRAEIVEELRIKLAEAFELKQQNREQEIEQLAEKLADLRQRIRQRSEARDRIIDARMKELLGELNW